MQNENTYLQLSSKRIKELSYNKGLGIGELANLCQCARVTISRIINGKYPLSDKLAAKLGNIFDVSPEYLQGKTDNPNRQSSILHNDQKLQLANMQNYRLGGIKLALERLGFSFIERLVIDGVKYKRSGISEFSPDTGDEMLDNKNFDEIEMSERIIHSQYCERYMDIRYQNETKTYTYTDFLCILNTLSHIMTNFMAISNQKYDKSSIVPDALDKAILQLLNVQNKKC